MRKKIAHFVVFLSLALFLFPHVVFSAETGNVGIYPTNFDPNNPATRAWFHLKLNPKDNYSSEVTIYNKANSVKKYEIYGVDATTTSDGVFTLFPKGVKNDLGGWITIPVSVIELQPNEKKNISFILNVPESASPGDHVAGIVVEEKQDTKQEGVSIVSRVGVRVYATVSGNTFENLMVGQPIFSDLINAKTIQLKLQNNGNINQKIKTNYQVVGVNGIKHFTVDTNKVVLAGKTVTTDDEINSLLPLYVSATVYYGDSFSKSQTATMVTSNAYIGGVVIFLFLLAILTQVVKNITGRRKYHDK